VFKELNNAATEKTKMTTHLYKWCSARRTDISTFGRAEFDVDGQEALLWEWCAAHTNDITSVGMVLNKLWE